VGQGLGTLTAGWIFNTIMSGPGDGTLEQWQSFWTIPLVFSVIVTLLFAFGFNEIRSDRSRTPLEKPAVEYK
jgi:hypothetical protein